MPYNVLTVPAGSLVPALIKPRISPIYSPVHHLKEIIQWIEAPFMSSSRTSCKFRLQVINLSASHLYECRLQFILLWSNLADDQALRPTGRVRETIDLHPELFQAGLWFRMLLFDQLQANNSPTRDKKMERRPIIATHNKGAWCSRWRVARIH